MAVKEVCHWNFWTSEWLPQASMGTSAEFHGLLTTYSQDMVASRSDKPVVVSRGSRPWLYPLIGQNSFSLHPLLLQTTLTSFWKEVIFGRLLSAFSEPLRLVANNSLCNCVVSLRKVVLGYRPGPDAPIVDIYVTIFIFLHRVEIRHHEEQRI